jgi:gallate decarboxylase subunit D
MDGMETSHFSINDPDSLQTIEAICIACGEDLVVVVGGGERHHIGAVALSISMPSLKDPHKLTNSSYLTPVPGHKEEDLARQGSLRLSKRLHKNVLLSVGIHDDGITREGIQRYIDLFNRLIEDILAAYGCLNCDLSD